MANSLEKHEFTAWNHKTSYLDYLSPFSKCCSRMSPTEKQLGLVGCSAFYSRASLSSPLCVCSDATYKLFALNIPGAILWFGIGKHSLNSQFLQNGGPYPDKEDRVRGEKHSFPPPQTTFLGKIPTESHRQEIKSSNFSRRWNSSGRQRCNFHLLKHLICI